MSLTIVRGPLPGAGGETIVPLRVDRHTLAKRRWRGVAEDGHEFGFDLLEPLRDGSIVHREEGRCWVIAQEPEPVLEISLAGVTSEEAARRGWLLGNLHFPVEVTDGVIRVADDPAIRPVLEREGVACSSFLRVFKPMGGHGHGHGHHAG